LKKKKRKRETSSSSEHESVIEKFMDSDADPDDSSTGSSSVGNVKKKRSTKSSGNFFEGLCLGDNTSLFSTDSDNTNEEEMKKTKTEYKISEDFDSTDEEDSELPNEKSNENEVRTKIDCYPTKEGAMEDVDSSSTSEEVNSRKQAERSSKSMAPKRAESKDDDSSEHETVTRIGRDPGTKSAEDRSIESSSSSESEA